MVSFPAAIVDYFLCSSDYPNFGLPPTQEIMQNNAYLVVALPGLQRLDRDIMLLSEKSLTLICFVPAHVGESAGTQASKIEITLHTS